MAKPTSEAGMGLEEVHEKGLGLTAEDPIGLDDKNGEEDEEEVPVAKKARVEKADNGLEEEEEDGYGVGFAEKDEDETELDPLLGHDNGAVESPVLEGEGEDDDDDSENGGADDGDDEDDEEESADVDAVSGKVDAPGDATGLRTLLQEGDATKTGGLLNGTDTLNGAK